MMCAWKQLLSVLPPRLRPEVDRLGKNALQELRLRLGMPPELVLSGESRWLGCCVSREDLNYCINAASRYSPWAAATTAQGYLTAPGGHRIGLCGEVVCKDGIVTGIREISSLCIRVARDFPGIAKRAADAPAIRQIGLFHFLFGKKWASTAAQPEYGILPFILTSVYGTAGAVIIGVPIGFLTAVYLAKMAPKPVKRFMEQAVSMLAGIPSVVYGLVGMMVLVPGLRKLFHIPDGSSLFAAIIVLAVMILPSIIKMSITALEAVPKEYEDASLALGATPEETYFRVSVPAAKSGIAAAVVLGVGRAIGEAMAVMMVAGNVPNMPTSLFQSVRFLTTAVASEMSYSSGLQKQALFSIALVLFLFIMLINAALNFFLKGDKAK